MRLFRGVSNKIDVETIATDVVMILWIKATITLPFRSSLTNLVMQWWQRICQKLFCTFGVFVLLINLRVHTESWILAQQFSRHEKVWKIEIKSGKMGKSLEFFSKLQQAGFICNYFFSFWSNLTQFSPYVCVPALFKVSIDHLFNNLESGKEIIVLEKVWKKSWILDPKICTNPQACCICYFLLSLSSLWLLELTSTFSMQNNNYDMRQLIFHQKSDHLMEMYNENDVCGYP